MPRFRVHANAGIHFVARHFDPAALMANPRLEIGGGIKSFRKNTILGRASEPNIFLFQGLRRPEIAQAF